MNIDLNGVSTVLHCAGGVGGGGWGSAGEDDRAAAVPCSTKPGDGRPGRDGTGERLPYREGVRVSVMRSR